MLNKKFLKTLLTTASTVAIVSGGATSVSAYWSTFSNDISIYQNGEEVNGFTSTNKAWGVEDEGNIDILYYQQNNSIIRTGSKNNVTIGNLASYYRTGSTLVTEANTTTISSVNSGFDDEGYNPGNDINFKTGAGSTLAFTSSTLNSVGTIDGASASGDGTVNFNSAVTSGHVGVIGGSKAVGTVNVKGASSAFSNAITATTLNIESGAASSTFGGAIDATTLNVNDNATFNAAVTAPTFTVAASKTASVNSALTVSTAFTNNGSVVLNNITFTMSGTASGGGTIKGNVNGHGKLVIDTEISSGAIGNIGEGAYLDIMTINQASTFNNKINARELNVNADTTIGYYNGVVVEIGDNIQLTSSGNFLGASVTLGSGGSLVLNELEGVYTTPSAIDGSADGNGEVIFNRVMINDGHITDMGAIGGTHKVATFTTTGDGSTFISAITATTMNVDGNTTFGGKLTATDLKLAASKTATTNAAIDATVTLGANSVLTIAAAGGTNGKTITGASDDSGKLVFSAAANNNVGAISKLNEVKIDAASAFDNSVEATNVNVNADTTFSEALTATTLTIAANKSATTGDDKLLTMNATVLHSGSKLTVGEGGIAGGTITADEADHGAVVFNKAVSKGDVGVIGGSGKNLATVTVNGANNEFDSAISTKTFALGAAAGAKMTATLTTTTGVTFAGNTTLTLDSAIAGGGTIETAVDNNGTVIFNAVQTESSVGNIGSSDHALNNIYVNGVGDNVFANIITDSIIIGDSAKTRAGAVTADKVTIDNTTLTTTGALKVSDKVNFSSANGGALVVDAIGGTNGGAITTSHNNVGTVTFDAKVDNNVGTIGYDEFVPTPLLAVTVNGVESTFNKAVCAKTVNINGGGSAINAAIVAQTLALGEDSATFTAGSTLIVTGEERTGEVTFAADTTLVVTGAATIDNITTVSSDGGVGTVIFTSAIAERTSGEGEHGVGNIGSSKAPLKALYLNGNALNTLSNNKVFVDDIYVAAGDGYEGLEIIKGSVVTANIRNASEDRADIKFRSVSEEVPSFKGTIGEVEGDDVKSVTIENYATMEGTVYTKLFDINNGAGLDLSGKLTINQAITVSGEEANIVMNDHDLHADSIKIGESHTLTINYGDASKTPGKLFLTAADATTDEGINSESTFVLKFTATPAVGTSYTLIDATASDIDEDNEDNLKTFLNSDQVTLDSPAHNFIDFGLKVDETGLLVQTESIARAKEAYKTISSNHSVTNSKYVSLLANYEGKTAGNVEKEYFASLNSATTDEVKDSFVKVSTIAPITTAVSAVTQSTHNVGTAAIEGRAMAAGDENREIGIWTKVFGEAGTQKARKGDAGFKSTALGVTLGADTEICDSTIVGIAGTFADANLKLKDQLSGGKVKAKTYMLSLYGIHNIDANWMVNGALSIGRTKSTVTTVGKAKFTATNLGAKVMAGYKYDMGDVMITPMVGLEFANYGKTKATEAVTNRIIDVKALNKASAIVGAKVSGEMSGFTPEVHAFMHYDMTGKAQVSTVKLGGDGTVDIATPHAKPARASFNLGTSVSAEHDEIEYGVGYDATISNKYVAHQGSIKVRVNF